MKHEPFSAKVIVLIVIIVSCITVMIYSSSITRVSFDPGFYEEHFERHDIRSLFNSSVNLTEQAGHLIAYLDKGTPLDSGFFNEKEKLHLVDVKSIYDRVRLITTVSAIIALAALVALFFVVRPEYASRSESKANEYLQSILADILIWTGVIVDALAVRLAVIALIFPGSFILFHHIFFDNELWILNPAVDNLIRMLPEVFFFEAFLKIIISSVMFATLMLIGGFLISLGRPRSRKK